MLKKLIIKDKTDKNEDKILYENNTVKEEINKWINFLECDSFSDILYKIGFNKNDIIKIYETKDKYVYGYTVNNEDRNSKNIIKLSYGSMVDFGPEIIIENEYGFKRYDCIPRSWNKDSEVVELNSFENKIDEFKSYRASCFIYSYLVEFKYSDHKILINIKKNIEDDKKINLKNELELEKYLSSLVFPLSITDLYNNICNICEIDVNKYPSFSVEVSKNDENSQKKITDMISLKNGIVNEFCITKDGKRIYVSNNGDWSYDMIDLDLVSFSLESKNQKINCIVSSNSNSELDDYTDSLIKYDISTARKEVEDTKVLVRSMFSKKSNSEESSSNCNKEEKQFDPSLWKPIGYKPVDVKPVYSKKHTGFVEYQAPEDRYEVRGVMPPAKNWYQQDLDEITKKLTLNKK